VSGPFESRDSSKEISEVNVVPLADVSLVLLILLLVLSPMMPQRMMAVQTAARGPDAPETPPKEEPPPQMEEPVLLVRLSIDGIIVGGKPLAGLAELLALVSAQLPVRKDKKVFLAPDPEVDLGRIVQTIEALRSCGALSVALVQTRA
jgi:biopolymer transport protein ExbD